MTYPVTVTKADVVKALHDTEKLIRQGWCQRRATRPKRLLGMITIGKCYCISAALDTVTVAHHDDYESISYDAYDKALAIKVNAQEWLRNALPKDFTGRFGNSVIYYNDNRQTKKQDIIALIRRALHNIETTGFNGAFGKEAKQDPQ
jgi:hypothetical protein